MDAIINILLKGHVLLGFTLLALFWIPMLSRKGSKVHVWAGRGYFWVMSVVLLTAAIACVYRLFTGGYLRSLFLGLLTLISFSALWQGYIAARFRKTVPDAHLLFVRIISWAVFLVSFPAIYYGIRLVHPLLIIFGSLGLFISAGVATGFRPPVPDISQYQVRMRRHYAFMIISGGAAYTAFLAFGSRTFFDLNEYGLGILPWILPTIMALLVVLWYNRSYPVKKPKETQALDTEV